MKKITLIAFACAVQYSALQASFKNNDAFAPQKSARELRRATEAAINKEASRLWHSLPEASKQNLYKTTILLFLSAAARQQAHNSATVQQSRSAVEVD